MTLHHKYGPSGAHRFIACPASVKLSETFPDTTNIYAEAGTLAHEISEKALRDGKNAIDYPDLLENKLFVNADISNPAEHIQGYINYVRDVAGKSQVFVEQKVALDPFIKNGFGTCDAIIRKGKHLHIIDLKFGTSWVSVKENYQLGLYALGAYNTLNKQHAEINKITLHVYQPRAGNINKWQTTPEWLLDLGRKTKQAIKLAEGPNPPINPSANACQWCKAKPVCPALYDQALATVGNDFDVLPPVETLSKDKAAHVLRHHKLLTSWLDDLKAYWIAQINDGNGLDGFIVQKRQGALEWTDGAEDFLTETLGDDAYERKLKTPAKLKKELKKLGHDVDDLEITKRKKDSNVLKEVVNENE